MTTANPLRGEASLRIAGQTYVLRPSFSALVAAEAELGPLYQLVERAAAGALSLTEITSLFWHCLEHLQAQVPAITKQAVGEAIVAQGLAASMMPMRSLLGQILKGDL